MSNNAGDRRSLLRGESDISDSASPFPSPVLSRAPRSLTSRHGYHRMSSSQDLSDHRPENAPSPSISETFDNSEEPRGLGISSNKRNSIPRKSVGSLASKPSRTPSHPFASEQDSPQIIDPSKGLVASPEIIYNGASISRGASEDEQPHKNIGRLPSFTEEFGGIEGVEDGKASIYSDHDRLIGPTGCPPHHDFHSHRTSWLSISILGLSIYSTIFSGIWLILSLVQPRYGRMIRSGGNLAPSTASTIFALFAKTIELSFVTVFVTFLGQVLSRRSLIKASRGVTIAEMTLRTWVIQPGFMITHWQHLQHVGLSILGGITLTAAFVAMFYTTASDALVSPHLKFGRWEDKSMYGLVQASYADPTFITEQCRTPITLEMDLTYSGSTCISIDYAGQAYHNSISYLSTWSDLSNGTSTNLTDRPQAPGMLYDNTTVTGSWILLNTSDITTAHQKYNRVINNVSLAMPHAGVLAAAQDEKNGILQPEDLAGVGQYQIKASVISPVVNVLCINMNATELDPLIYVTWPNAQTTNSTSVPGQKMAWAGYEEDSQVLPGQQYANSTVVDDFFEWGEKYNRQPPIFPMLPIDYNSLTNISAPYSPTLYPGEDSVYLLIKSPSTTDYTMCQMRSFVSPSCNTQYNVSGTTGNSLESHCEDAHDEMAYSATTKNALTVRSIDWRNVAAQWLLSTSMNTGVSNANASVARLLSQFVVPTPSSGDVHLNSTLPSLSEMLAVMLGSTLLSSTTLSSYYHFWDHENATLNSPVYQTFNASLTTQQYTSGFTQKWEAIFYIVLLLVFATNVFCLVYLFGRSGLVTDYTEPQNLFALAINSPPSEALNGSCGAGPHGDQLNVDWHVRQEPFPSLHLFFQDGGPKTGSPLPQDYEVRRRKSAHMRSMRSYSKLSSTRASWL